MVILSDYFKEITINQDYIESIEIMEDLCNEHAIEFLRRHGIENPEEMIAQYNDHIFSEQKIYTGCSAIVVPIMLPREVLQDIIQNSHKEQESTESNNDNGNTTINSNASSLNNAVEVSNKNSDSNNLGNVEDDKTNSDETVVSIVEHNVEQPKVEYSETTESAVIVTQQNQALLNTTIDYKAVHQSIASQSLFVNLLVVKNSSVVGEDYRIINNIFIVFKPVLTEEEIKTAKQNSHALMLVSRIQKLLWYTPFTFQIQKKSSPEEILELIHKYEELLIA